jgi:hypothetical protein
MKNMHEYWLIVPRILEMFSSIHYIYESAHESAGCLDQECVTILLNDDSQLKLFKSYDSMKGGHEVPK